jgi:uncharacterized iron-regulated membrane protein
VRSKETPRVPAPSKSKIRLRNLWFSIHKWLGITLAILIVPISLTGSALVWHDALDTALNPDRVVDSGPPSLDAQAYGDAALRALEPGHRIASIRFPAPRGPVVVTAVRPAPGATRLPRTTVWLHPEDARILDRAGSNDGFVRILHRLHGSLMVPGVGRQFVGWVGVAMLASSLTGLWLWWPVGGGLGRGLRWRRQPTTNANLHHLAGFWIAVPLAMLSFTGVWISFPGMFGGAAPPAAAGARAGPPLPVVETRQSADTVRWAGLRRDRGHLETIVWPTDRAPYWTVAYRSEEGSYEFRVDDASRAVTAPGPQPETTARTMRRWHDGTGMGPIWQIVIFIGGILPALLAVTGIVMWLRTRKWRGGPKRAASSSPGGEGDHACPERRRRRRVKHGGG